MRKTDSRGEINRRFSRHKRPRLKINKLALYKEVIAVLRTKQNTRARACVLFRSTLSHKRHDFLGNAFDHKMCFDFLHTFSLENFSF